MNGNEDHIEQLLRQHRISVEEVAARLYSTTAALRKILNRGPTMDEVADLAWAAHLSITGGGFRNDQFEQLYYRFAAVCGFSPDSNSDRVGHDIRRGTRNFVNVGVVKSPPLAEFKDGAASGPAVDYTKRILKTAGLSGRYMSLGNSEVLFRIMSREIELVVPAWMSLPSRRPLVFSNPVSTPIPIAALVHKSFNTVVQRGVPAFDGVEINTIRGEAGDIVAPLVFRRARRAPAHYSPERAIEVLRTADSERRPVLVADVILCLEFGRRNQDLKIVELPVRIPFPVAFVMHPCEPTLKRVVNSAIASIGPMPLNNFLTQRDGKRFAERSSQ